MITPRRTRLVRAPDLQAFRHAACALVRKSVEDGRDPLILVPTSAAGEEFRRTLALAGGVSKSDLRIVTRDTLYDDLVDRLPAPVSRLNAFERHSVMQSSAELAAGQVPALTFRVRPGLVAEVTAFYDQLRRQGQRVDRFESIIEDAVGVERAADDRGAARTLDVTRWLAATFREYERRVDAIGRVDEHSLRQRLLARPLEATVDHVIVTVADWVAEPDGLFVADFDLLARLPGLRELDLVSTDAVLASGFHERLREWLPEIDEQSSADVSEARHDRPRLIVPAPDTNWFTCRDREEELVAVARRIKAERRESPASAPQLDRIAVVFKRPLPYLYVAGETFGSSGIPYTSSSALPLAAEPTAAAVDLLVDAVESDFTRDAIVALLRSPHFTQVATPGAIDALNRALSGAQYLGGLDRLTALADVWRSSAPPDVEAALSAMDAAIHWATALTPLAGPAPASKLIELLSLVLADRWRPHADNDMWRWREQRARTAISETLASLGRAHSEHHDPSWTIAELGPAVRSWIEEQTFLPAAPSSGGVRLIDDRAARYGDFDTVAIVGLVEQDWPEPRGTNVFYPRTVLNALGWPSERDWRAAEDARLLDLVESPRRQVMLSCFTLDDERVAMRSIQLDEIHRARLTTLTGPPAKPARIFAHEALALGTPSLDALDESARGWAELRLSRPSREDGVFHGAVGTHAPRRWSVSALETYLTCPFKCFAQHVLRLDEEPDDEEIMDPRRQGRFVHAVFEAFFQAWQANREGAITAANLDRARTLFGDVVQTTLTSLPPAEAEVQRTHLLGSAAATGLGEAVLRMEAERDVPVVGRLLEHPLKGTFAFQTPDAVRTVDLNGKADRLDLLADGTFRLIDYKLGWPPKGSQALQLGTYAICAEQRLEGFRGRSWKVGEAVYLAFKGPRRVTPLFNSSTDRDRILADIQMRVIGTIDRIHAGEFPPHPEDVFHCERCAFGSVCRKDYVGDV